MGGMQVPPICHFFKKKKPRHTVTSGSDVTLGCDLISEASFCPWH